MIREYRSLLIGLFLVAAISVPQALADNLLLPTLIPVTGAGGQAINGQFTLSSATEYAILSNTAFGTATQGYGTYTDLVGPTFTVVDPRSATALALGSYQFSPGTPQNTIVTGTLSLFYTLYSVDPNSPTFDPIADYISNDGISISGERFLDQQSNAGPPLQAPVPEPGSWSLAAVALLLVSGSLLRQRAWHQ